MIGLQWVASSTPSYLVFLLLGTLVIVLGAAWRERPRDPWTDLARRDRRRVRR